MDRENKLAYLSAVETAVSDSLRRIAHQEQLLAELNRDGQDTKVPTAMLASLRRVQAEQLAIRDLLLKSLHNRSAIAKSGPG